MFPYVTKSANDSIANCAVLREHFKSGKAFVNLLRKMAVDVRGKVDNAVGIFLACPYPAPDKAVERLCRPTVAVIFRMAAVHTAFVVLTA